MVLDVQKHLKASQVFMLNNLCFNKFAQNSSPGAVLALGLLLAVFGPGPGWLSMALGLAQVVLDVLENIKPIQFCMLNNIC